MALDACPILPQTAVAQDILACFGPKRWHEGNGGFLKCHNIYGFMLTPVLLSKMTYRNKFHELISTQDLYTVVSSLFFETEDRRNANQFADNVFSRHCPFNDMVLTKNLLGARM